MFDNQRNIDVARSTTLSRIEIEVVQDALDSAIDGFLSSLSDEHKLTVCQMLIDMSSSLKITYLLSPASIRSLINTYMSHDPHRDAIEDMTARFLTQLDNVEQTLPKLINTLSYGYSAHNKSKLLARTMVDETVDQQNVVKVLDSELWLVFITSITAYYNSYRLEAMIERNKVKGEK